MLGTTAIGVGMALLVAGFGALPLAFVAAPAALGVGCLVASMGSLTWARLTAALYVGAFLLMIGAFLTS